MYQIGVCNCLNKYEEQLRRYGLTPEKYEQCLQDIHDKVLGVEDQDWADIVLKYNLPMSKDTVRKASSQEIFGNVFVLDYFREKEKTKDNASVVEQTHRTEMSINKDGSFLSSKLIAINENDLKSPNSLLKAHGFDIREWELVSAKNNAWNAYSKQDGIKELYSSKIVIKPRKEISLQEIEEFYKELVNTYKPPVVKKYENSKDGYMLEITIVDLHLGKFSTSDIVKDEYNSQIARECFNKIIDTCISRCKGLNIEKIIFPVGNDFFHFDTVGTTTTSGTPQDADVKHQTLFKDGVVLLIDGISKLSRELKAPIEVFCVQGNHDFMTSYHALMSLWCYFNNNENVTVNLSTSPRKYIEYGNVLLGFTHGDKEKKRLRNLMQVEEAQAWGRTKFREFHAGHLHSEQQVTEDGGVIIKNLSSVTGTDAWHHNSGYVGAIRKCTCFLWDKENGLDSTFNVVVS